MLPAWAAETARSWRGSCCADSAHGPGRGRPRSAASPRLAWRSFSLLGTRPGTESLVPLPARITARWSWIPREVRPCRLRAGNTTLDTCQRNLCTPVTPLPRRHRPRCCTATAGLSRLALMPSTGVARGWRDAPAAAQPSRRSSPSCPRTQAGRIQPTCCCAGITTGRPGPHLISRAPRSWTSTVGESLATYGRLALARDDRQACPPRLRSRPGRMIRERPPSKSQAASASFSAFTNS